MRKLGDVDSFADNGDSIVNVGGALASLPLLTRAPPSSPFEEELVKTADGGTVHLLWCPSRAAAPTSRGIVLITPGLNTSSRWAYIKHAMGNLALLGFVAVCFDYRGECAPLTSPRMGSADSWRDVYEVLAVMQRACPPNDVPLFGIGFSAGGTLLAKYLSDAGASSPLRAAVTVSSPLDLCMFFRHLDSSSVFNRLLAFVLANRAKVTFLQHAHSDALKGLHWGKMALSTGLPELEAAIIDSGHFLGAYGSREEYHRACSPSLREVAVPLLSVHAMDDRVVPVSTLPLDDIKANDHCMLALSRRGGHLGWPARWRGRQGEQVAPTWADDIGVRFLISHLPSLAPSPHRELREMRDSVLSPFDAHAADNRNPETRSRL